MWYFFPALGLSLDSVELSKDQKSLSRDSGLTLSEDDRDSPGLNYHNPSFHRSDWARQAARIRSLDNTWIEEDEAFCASNESLCGPPIPPRRTPPLRHLPPVHLPPMYRPPPPPPPAGGGRRPPHRPPPRGRGDDGGVATRTFYVVRRCAFSTSLYVDVRAGMDARNNK